MKNYGIGPKRCRGTTLSPGNSIHRRRMAGKFYGFHFFSGVGPFSLYLFFPSNHRRVPGG